ncbi:efflux transporter outer membrane subunit [Hymenobacter sp. YC55]|uniref:efflux transporter outer membrane subunit n=1 Tax=Hymenobacter sp. YC55 TaxID=3034019 RepID=UPI0023F9A550|nr:efflux transporter outer membrane subunit [Hymenobacter sp. YC55]MDF7810018.1 efflux transporter outer membrane subunit [Hymenobacter sp. YC55]
MSFFTAWYSLVRWSWALGLTSVVLVGCVRGPQYQPPSVAAPAAWQNNQNPVGAPVAQPAAPTTPASPQVAPAVSSWWTLFNDPVLNALEQQALTGNFNVRAAASRVEEARATVRIANSYLKPDVTVTPQVYRSRLSALRPVQFPNAQVVGVSQKQFYIPINVSYEVDVWGRIRRDIQASQAEQQASEADLRTVQLTLTTDAASYYYSVRGLDADLGVLDSTREARVQNLKLVQARYKAGVDNEIGVRRAETELANVDASRIEVQRQRARYVAALATVCGQPASSFALAPRPTDLTVPSVPAGVPAALLARRPDLQQAERLLAAADSRAESARLARLPTVQLNGYIGPQSAQLGELTRLSESYTYYVGAGVAIPIFNGGRLRSNEELAKARTYTVSAQYQQTALVAFQEVETALADVQQSAAQLEAQQRALRSARQAGLLTRERYNRGLTTYFEVVDADRQTLEAARQAVQTQSFQFQSAIQLIKALGGSWE